MFDPARETDPPPVHSVASRLARLSSAAERVESLASEYHAILRPLRDALQAVADSPFETPDEWLQAVAQLANQLIAEGMADVPNALLVAPRWLNAFDGGEPGRAFVGEAFCATLAGVSAEGTAPAGFFVTQGNYSFITRDVAAREICAVLSNLLHTLTARTAPRFAERYGLILSDAGMCSETLQLRLAQCCMALSVNASMALLDWDECRTGVPFYHNVEIRTSAPAAMSQNEAPAEGGGGEGSSFATGEKAPNAPPEEAISAARKRFTPEDRERIEQTVIEYLTRATAAATQGERTARARAVVIVDVAKAAGCSPGYLSQSCRAWQSFEGERKAQAEAGAPPDALDRALTQKKFAKPRGRQTKLAGHDGARDGKQAGSCGNGMDSLPDPTAIDPLEAASLAELRDSLTPEAREHFDTLTSAEQAELLNLITEQRADEFADAPRRKKSRS